MWKYALWVWHNTHILVTRVFFNLTHQTTLRTAYPPPPNTNVGMLNFLKKCYTLPMSPVTQVKNHHNLQSLTGQRYKLCILLRPAPVWEFSMSWRMLRTPHIYSDSKFTPTIVYNHSPGDVANGVSSSAQHHSGDVKLLNECYALLIFVVTQVFFNQTHRATLRTVYPPPPNTRVGMLNFLTNVTHSPCPLMLRLKHPNRSCARESAPHWSTIAVGR